MKLLEGKKISEKILETLKNSIKKEKLKPALAVFLVGADPASEIYVDLKGKTARKIGMDFQLFRFIETSKEEDILEKIKELNGDKNTNGIIVQLPLPKKFNTQKIINAIGPKKDVDGFHPENEKAFLSGAESFWPVFPHAILRLLEGSGEDLKNKGSVVIANSKKFGEVMAAALKKKNIPGAYILCRELKEDSLKDSDIVISACGIPGIVHGKMLKKGAIVIDGGITKKDRKTLGDADFESVKKVASHLSPVPGGVGPVTIACLLENVYLASKRNKP